MHLDHPLQWPRPTSLACPALIISTIGAFFLTGSAAPAAAQDETTAVRVVADQVRSQGFACANATSVERIAAESTPDRPVYMLTCNAAKYRVQMIPDQAAKITKVE